MPLTPKIAALGMLCFSVFLQTILTFAVNTSSQWLNCNMQAPGVSEFSFGLSSIAVQFKSETFDTVIYETSLEYTSLEVVKDVVGEIGLLITATSSVYWLCLMGLFFGLVAVGLGAAGAAAGTKYNNKLFVVAGSFLLFDFLLTFIGWAVYSFGVSAELKKLKLVDIIKAVMEVGGGSFTLVQYFFVGQATKCDDQSAMTGSTLTALTAFLMLMASISVLGLSCAMCSAPNEQAGQGMYNDPMMQGRQAGGMQMQQMPSGGAPYAGGAWPPSGGHPGGGAPYGGYPGGGAPPPPMQMHQGNGRSPTGY